MSRTSKLIILSAIILVHAFTVSAAQDDPRHPLSQVHPIDIGLNMSEKDIFNVSELRLSGSGFEIKGFSIMNEGGQYKLELDNGSGEFDVWGANLDLNQNSLGSSNNALSLFSNLDASGNRIKNVPKPSSGGDAVNKSYVDFEAQDAEDNATQDLSQVLSRGNVAYPYDINLNGSNITSSTGTVNLKGKVYLPTGNLDMAGNNIINSGVVDGIDLDNPGNALEIDNSRLVVKNNGIADEEINNTERLTLKGLDSTGNIDLHENPLSNVSEVTGSGNLILSGNGNTEGVVIEQGDGSTVLEAGKNGGNVNIYKDLELNNHILAQGSGDFNIDGNGQNIVNRLSTGDSFIVSDKDTSEDLLEVNTDGTVRVPSGNIDLEGHKITDNTSSNTVYIGDGKGDDVELKAGGSGSVLIESGDTSGGSIKRLKITSDSGNGDLDVMNADLDLNSNSLKGYYGSQCPSGKALKDIGNDGTFTCVDVAGEVSDVYVNRSGDSMTGNLDMNGNEVNDVGSVGVGTSSPQENLDVDGSASVENSGTRMEVDSSGNVVVTLGQ